MKTRKKRRKLLKNQDGIVSPFEGVVAFGTAIAILLFFYIGINTFFAEYEDNSIEISAKTVGISEKSICGPGLADGWNMDWHKEDDLLGLTDFGLGVNTESKECLLDPQGNLQVNQFYLFTGLRQLDDVPIDPSVDYLPLSIEDRLRRLINPRGYGALMHTPGYEIPVFEGRAYCEFIPPSTGDESLFLQLQYSEEFPYAILHGQKIEELMECPVDTNPEVYKVVKDAIGLERYVDFTFEITQIDGTELLDYGKIPEQWQTKESFSRIVFVEEYEYKEELGIEISTNTGEIAELVITIYQ